MDDDLDEFDDWDEALPPLDDDCLPELDDEPDLDRRDFAWPEDEE